MSAVGFLTPFIRNGAVQYVTMSLYIMHNAFTVGSINLFIINMFGFQLLGPLVTSYSVLLATVNTVAKKFWVVFVYETCQQDFTKPHIIILAFSMVGAACPLVIKYMIRRDADPDEEIKPLTAPRKSREHERKSLDRGHLAPSNVASRMSVISDAGSGY
eukprot:GHVU01038136.1.p1 GENE.GHVU01038136.1~~GHVU01038136.1.p1  ORF type:complete len:159 (-),score=9.15 GHVU01038136.1:3-479(-)